MKSYEELKVKNLPAHNTAIVVIDVWDKTNFNNYVTKSLNPFLEKAKEGGYLFNKRAITRKGQSKPDQSI